MLNMSFSVINAKPLDSLPASADNRSTSDKLLTPWIRDGGTNVLWSLFNWLMGLFHWHHVPRLRWTFSVGGKGPVLASKWTAVTSRGCSQPVTTPRESQLLSGGRPELFYKSLCVQLQNVRGLWWTLWLEDFYFYIFAISLREVVSGHGWTTFPEFAASE